MRYLGTLMLLACVAMLLFPSLWEGRCGRPRPGRVAASDPGGRSTLTRRTTSLPPGAGPAAAMKTVELRGPAAYLRSPPANRILTL